MYQLGLFPAPGYVFTVVCGPVARVRRLRRDPGSVPGLMYQLGLFPAPGYVFTVVCGPVARTGAPSPPPGFPVL